MRKSFSADFDKPSRRTLLGVTCAFLGSRLVGAEEPEEKNTNTSTSPAAIRWGDTAVSKWKVGVVIKAQGNMTGIVATTPIFMDWPEQTVKVVEEETSPQVKKVSYRVLDSGVRQMVVSIPKLEEGDEASVAITFEITKRLIESPEETAELVIPKKASKELTKYLGPSPFIEIADAKIKQASATIATDQEEAWQQVESIFDWVRNNIRYQFATEIKPAPVALRDKVGDCEELTSLFIAFCRLHKIPARAVWVPGHCYPEFYLQDAAGNGHWYPCQAAGAAHDFGRMPEIRPILQKGDNFKVPEEAKPQRYVKQFLKAASSEAPPEVKFLLQQVGPTLIYPQGGGKPVERDANTRADGLEDSEKE